MIAKNWRKKKRGKHRRGEKSCPPAFLGGFPPQRRIRDTLGGIHFVDGILGHMRMFETIWESCRIDNHRRKAHIQPISMAPREAQRPNILSISRTKSRAASGEILRVQGKTTKIKKKSPVPQLHLPCNIKGPRRPLKTLHRCGIAESGGRMPNSSKMCGYHHFMSGHKILRGS